MYMVKESIDQKEYPGIKRTEHLESYPSDKAENISKEELKSFL